MCTLDYKYNTPEREEMKFGDEQRQRLRASLSRALVQPIKTKLPTGFAATLDSIPTTTEAESLQ